MFQGKRVLCVIPIRSGSKCIKNLNIYPVYNKPLFLITCDTAKMSKYIDTICITTDSMKYALIATENGYNIPFIRPASLATDEANLIDVVVHARDFYWKNNDIYDCVVTLTANSPLKTSEDIDLAIEEYYFNCGKSIVSITECDIYPQLIRTIKNERLSKVINDFGHNKIFLPKYYNIVESIYINDFLSLNSGNNLNDNEKGFLLSKEKSLIIKDKNTLKEVRSKIKSLKVSEYLKTNKREKKG